MGKLIIEVPVWGGGELWQVMVGQGGRRHRAASVQIVLVQVQKIISVLVQQIRLRKSLKEKKKNMRGTNHSCFAIYSIFTTSSTKM